MIEDIFAFCEEHRIKGIGARWLVAEMSSGLPAIIDMRDQGIVGLILNGGLPTSGAVPFEIIGGKLNEENALPFYRNLMAKAAALDIEWLDVSSCSDVSHLSEQFVAVQEGCLNYTEIEMVCEKLESQEAAPLPENWRWEDLSRERAPQYEALRRAAFQGIPGVVLGAGTASYESLSNLKMRLLVTPHEIAGSIRFDPASGFIWSILRHPHYRGQGVGVILMEELARLYRGAKASLCVIDRNFPALKLYRRYGFFSFLERPFYKVRVKGVNSRS